MTRACLRSAVQSHIGMTRIGIPTLLITALLNGPVSALDLAQCTRTTNPSHGGQSDHVDLGEGRVMWQDWWSLEGSATNVVIEECATGQRLDVRTAETNMHPTRTSFDRTDDVLDVIALHESGARVFATLTRIASDVDRIGRDITLSSHPSESCACAALYPTLQGDRTPFWLTD